MRKCKVCSNKTWLKEINLRLIRKHQTGESFASIAKDYEGLDKQNLQWHYNNHLKDSSNEKDKTDNYCPRNTLNNSQNVDGLDDNPDDLNDSEVNLQEKEAQAWDIYEKSLKSGDLQLALKAEQIAVDLLKLQDKRKDEGHGQVVNITDTPEYQEMMDVILRVLDKYPEVRRELEHELEKLTAKT